MIISLAIVSHFAGNPRVDQFESKNVSVFARVFHTLTECHKDSYVCNAVLIK